MSPWIPQAASVSVLIWLGNMPRPWGSVNQIQKQNFGRIGYCKRASTKMNGLSTLKRAAIIKTPRGRPATVSVFRVRKILIDWGRMLIFLKWSPYGHVTIATENSPTWNRMVKRISDGTEIRLLAEEMQKMEGKIRQSYEKVTYWSSETLAWMMALDSTFLLELLRTLTGTTGEEYPTSGDMYFEPIFDENRIQSVGFAVLADILQLENQIPLFALGKMLELEGGSEAERCASLSRLLLSAASTFFPFKSLQPDC